MLWVFKYSYFSAVPYLLPYFKANSLNDTLRVPEHLQGRTAPPSSGGGRAATHPQGVPNTVQSSHRRRQVPLSVSCPFIGPERSPNLKNRPQLALTLPFKRLLKRHFFVKVASLKFLCEKKAQRSGESRKRKVPGLPPHKRSLARAQIEDFLVRYSRSTNLVSEQRRLSCWNGCQTRWNEVSELANSLIKPIKKKTSSALLWTPRKERCARTGRRNLLRFD